MANVSSPWTDYVMYRRKVIERSDNDEEKLRNIEKLQKVPITIELLQETGIGRVLRQLCKENGMVGERANLLMTKWKGAVALCKASNNKSGETVCSKSKSSNVVGDKTDVSKNRKSANGHTRNNGIFPTEHSQSTKQHKKQSASITDIDKDPHKDSGFCEEPDFHWTANQRHMSPDEFVKAEDEISSYEGGGGEDDEEEEEENVPYNSSEVSKYTSYLEYVRFADNEYNPEFPALFGTSKHNQPENKNRNSYEQEKGKHLVTGTQNGILSSKEHVASDKSEVKHKSSHNVKNSSSSTKLPENEKSGSQLKYKGTSFTQNSSGSSKVKYEGQCEDLSQKGKHKSQSKSQDISKSKEKTLVISEKHHSSKSSSLNDSLLLKRKHYEETDSSVKDCSSLSSSSPISRPSEKHYDQNSQQLHKKFKEEDSSKKFKDHPKASRPSSSSSSKENYSLKSSSSSHESIPKESNKILKTSEKPHKESSSHKDKSKTNCKSPLAANKTANIKTSLSVDTEGFTSTEASFEACLGFNDIVSVKKKKSSKSSSAASNSPKDKIPKSSSSKESSSKTSAQGSKKTSSSSSHLKNKEISKPKSTSKLGTDLSEDNSKKKLKISEDNSKKKLKISEDNSKKKLKISESPETFEVPKPFEMEVDIMSTLPEIQPNYKPLSSYRLDSPSQKRTAALTNEEAIMFTTSRKEKTAVYSGRKSHYLTEVSSLQEMCVRILIENIDSIGYIGGVPYMILKPVLERCTAKQLYGIEDFNAYLLEDTGELWKKHCTRTYRNQHPEAGETWRDLYIRLHDEQESKLRSVTRNISASMSKATPVRQTKLAYVDSVVKPPRDVARKQAKHGTALPVNHTMKAGPPSKASPRPTAPAINAAASPKPSSPVPPPSSNSSSKAVKRTAPLMMKTLKDFKKVFRR